MHAETSLPPRPINIASWSAAIEESPGGVFYVRPELELGAYPRTLTECLEAWAERTPERTFLAERGAQGEWRRVSYAEFRIRARGVAQALLDLELAATSYRNSLRQRS